MRITVHRVRFDTAGIRVLPALLALLLVTGSMAACASLPGREAPVAVDEPEVDLTPAPSPLSLPEPLARQSPSARAAMLLEAGAFEEAGRHYERILRAPPNDREHAEALWGLALMHLVPESPLHDPERAGGYLEKLAEHFPRTVHGIQARWAQGLLGELDGARAQAAEQARLLREIRDTLERLREIDLERRPTGRPPRPDTLVSQEGRPPVG